MIAIMLKLQVGYGCGNIAQPQGSYERGVYEEAFFHAATEDHNDGCGDDECVEGSVSLSDLTAKARNYQIHQPKHQQAQHV